MTKRRVTPIVTSRLVLVPVTPELARAVVAGDLADISAGPGWPHADTVDAMAMALAPRAGPAWLVTADGLVIGDCGSYAWPDEEGVVEIGYGVAEPFRRKGYATEAVAGMCRWLRAEAGAIAITATSVDAGNHASRRVLEKLGFARVDESDLHVSYRLG